MDYIGVDPTHAPLPLQAPPRGSRLAHRARLLADRHAWTALVVAGSACVFSFGLVYVGYFAHVLRTARRAPSRPAGAGCLLVFGKHAPDGRIDGDFQGRLQRAADVWRQSPARPLVLLGGGFGEGESEAEVAQRRLLAAGVAADATWLLESGSRDTLQNLRNARALLGDRTGTGPVVLLSSRYHLARCALFARWLGYEPNCARPNRRCAGPRSRCGGLPANRPACAGSTWARAGRGWSATARCWRGSAERAARDGHGPHPSSGRLSRQRRRRRAGRATRVQRIGARQRPRKDSARR